ncbi:unnamed protein product, partial [Heterosigma akashiwo]
GCVSGSSTRTSCPSDTAPSPSVPPPVWELSSPPRSPVSAQPAGCLSLGLGSEACCSHLVVPVIIPCSVARSCVPLQQDGVRDHIGCHACGLHAAKPLLHQVCVP